MSKYGGTVIKTPLSKEGEKDLRRPCTAEAPAERLIYTQPPAGQPEG
jgi:hypothetical protein